MATVIRIIITVGLVLAGAVSAVMAQGFDIHSDFMPVLRDARIDGTLYINLPLCAVNERKDMPIWPITLKHALEMEGREARSVVTIRGFRTSLASYGVNQYIWNGPSGQDLQLDISRQRRNGADCGIIVWNLGDDVMLVTDSGWRMYYESGYLKRAVNASGLTLRFYGNGPIIERITTGSLYEETELLRFGYSDPVTPVFVRCNSATLALKYTGHSIEQVLSDNTSINVHISYRDGLISGVSVGGVDNAIRWEKVSASDFALIHLNPYGIVIKQVRNTEYAVSASQTTVAIVANVGGALERMIGNNYSRSVKYESETR